MAGDVDGHRDFSNDLCEHDIRRREESVREGRRVGNQGKLRVINVYNNVKTRKSVRCCLCTPDTLQLFRPCRGRSVVTQTPLCSLLSDTPELYRQPRNAARSEGDKRHSGASGAEQLHIRALHRHVTDSFIMYRVFCSLGPSLCVDGVSSAATAPTRQSDGEARDEILQITVAVDRNGLLER
ncbi:hypothetical protein KGM_213181 [Danaus plexippus plexippus]|uniref:Uncharacterized protein n=1 Tax=Danaus plexippus plexippus TaxID=278856 RepID=A0A212FAW1_DANPL|nr:hypothetical protein KGM_213181 [Danaus plexippus plexippus]